jgi:hypothetical protein
VDYAARFDRLLHKGQQALGRSIYDQAHANPTDPRSILLRAIIYLPDQKVLG